MRKTLGSAVWAVGVLGIVGIGGFGGGSPAAASSAPAPSPADEEVFRVERFEEERTKEPTLRFLEENRAFFRAQLDRLRVTLGPQEGSAGALDPRWLAWQEMLAAIEAARARVAEGEARIRDTESLPSVEDLLALERAMAEMESLLDEQHDRLALLEEDFVGRQETALVLMMTGMPVGGSPATFVVEDPDGEDWIVDLGDDERLTLARGGTIELAHRRIEPRAHELSVRLVAADGVDGPAWTLPLDPARDRITFVEIDVEGHDPAGGAAPPAEVWSR